MLEPRPQTTGALPNVSTTDRPPPDPACEQRTTSPFRSAAVERRAATPSGLTLPAAAAVSRPAQFAVDVDCFRHTTLRDAISARPGSHNLSHFKVRDALQHQQHVKQQLEAIQRQSNAPSLVRLYAASIREPHDPRRALAGGSAASDRDTSPSWRHISDQVDSVAHRVASVRTLQKVAAATTILNDRIILPPCEIPPLQITDDRARSAYGTRTVDRRPQAPSALTLFYEKLHTQQQDISAPAEGVVCDRPASPFRSASAHDDPSKVYTPAGLHELLKSCVVKENSSPMQHVRRLQINADAPPRQSPLEVERLERAEVARAAVERRFTKLRHLNESVQLLHSSPTVKAGVAPTHATESVRRRLGGVKLQLRRKLMGGTEMLSDHLMSLSGGGSSPMSVGGGGGGAQSGAAASETNLLITHRKGIVKRMYNNIV